MFFLPHRPIVRNAEEIPRFVSSPIFVSEASLPHRGSEGPTGRTWAIRPTRRGIQGRRAAPEGNRPLEPHEPAEDVWELRRRLLNDYENQELRRRYLAARTPLLLEEDELSGKMNIHPGTILWVPFLPLLMLAGAAVLGWIGGGITAVFSSLVGLPHRVFQSSLARLGAAFVCSWIAIAQYGEREPQNHLISLAVATIAGTAAGYYWGIGWHEARSFPLWVDAHGRFQGGGAALTLAYGGSAGTVAVLTSLMLLVPRVLVRVMLRIRNRRRIRAELGPLPPDAPDDLVAARKRYLA